MVHGAHCIWLLCWYPMLSCTFSNHYRRCWPWCWLCCLVMVELSCHRARCLMHLRLLTRWRNKEGRQTKKSVWGDCVVKIQVCMTNWRFPEQTRLKHPPFLSKQLSCPCCHIQVLESTLKVDNTYSTTGTVVRYFRVAVNWTPPSICSQSVIPS